ncbi:hypothetical protein Tco_1277382, partial [Tanacetum coccineum]
LDYGRYGVLTEVNTTYQGFLEVGTTYKYIVSSFMDTAYWMSEHFFHLHSEFASGHDASANSTAEADLGLSAPNDSIP